MRRAGPVDGGNGVRRKPMLVLGAMLAAFVLARLVVLRGGQVFTSFDTFSYAYRTDAAFNRGPLVSFTGHAPRLWGAPLFYALFPTDSGRAIGQWALGTLAWAVLAVVLWRCLTGMVARVTAVGGTLLLGLSVQVTSWDFAILSESLSISLGVLTLAGLIGWLRLYSLPWLGLAVGVTFWWIFVRPEVRLMAGVILVVLLVHAWRGRSLDRRRRVALLGAGAALLVAVGWVSVITPTVSETFSRWSATGLSLDEETLNYRLRLQVLPDAEIKGVYQGELGMPPCPGADRAATAREWAIRDFSVEYKGCPELKAWGERHALDSGYRFALAAPGEQLRFTAGVLPAALGGVAYAQGTAILPGVLNWIPFPPRGVLLYALLAAYAAGLLAAWLMGAYRRHRLLVVTSVVTAAVSLASVLAGLLFSVGEYSRFGIQEAVGVRLGVVLLVAAVLDSVVERVRERRAVVGYGAGSDRDLEKEPSNG
jgi:hypothetical protein